MQLTCLAIVFNLIFLLWVIIKRKKKLLSGKPKKLVCKLDGNENLCICTKNRPGHDSKVRSDSCSNQAHMHVEN
jgi:hypothetical protein